MPPYLTLKARFDRIAKLKAADALLFWDGRVMMPGGSAAERGKIVAELRAVQHAILTAPETEALLAETEAQAADLTAWDAANLREMRRLWRRHAMLDGELVREIAAATVRAQTAWGQARQDKDFGIFATAFAPLLSLQREAAAMKAQDYSTPYDSFLDECEPGLTRAMVDELFAELERFLPELTAQVAGAPPALPLPAISADAQKAFCEHLLRRLGYDFSRGRLDATVHPFAVTGAPDDYRITTRFNEAAPLSAIMAGIHEMGHASYEAGLPHDWRYQPVGSARGGAMHESQSLLFEMQAARSGEFLTFLARELAQEFGPHPASDPSNLVRLCRAVAPGEIRVGADEVTYPLHIILRYRLETALIDGQLAVNDIPEAWNALSRQLLGVSPRDDVHGCLQDMHWSIGLLGYFPTYTFGAVIAAQMFEACAASEAALPEALAAGDLTPLRTWARANVHAHGSRYPAPELIERATGRPLSAEPFKRHLLARYLKD